ncbi:MAG: hypothetical protein IPJ69_07130 [Deltaproteobacteria bacterium]|nr:MAG: hypothetical protein IPJ69_07130 [Deltaproteobacteria bacterium]
MSEKLGSGELVPTDQLRTAVDQFLRQESESLHDTLRQPYPSTVRLFYTSPKVAFDVEHQAHPLSVGRRIIDPLLDFPPYHEVFSALEAFTEGGPRLHFYSLGLYACAQPGMAPLTPSIVFDLLENPHCRCLMIEKVLYLVDTKTIPHAVLQPLDEALRQGYVIEVKPILVTPGALPKISKPDSAAIQSRFAPSPSSLVPQAQIQHKVEARWLYGDNIPTTDAFQDIPSLKAWLDAHHKLLHETDMRKIRKCIEAIWRRCCDEATYEEQIDNLKDQLLGILGEVSHRPSILNEYHEARQLYPDSLLFVEGEISISNRKASDALIGIFTPAGELVITHLFEVSVDYRSEEPLHVQQRATMLDRLPNEGLTLHVSETESYDVSPQAEATLGYVFLSTRSQHQEFQILTQKIVGEIMSLLTLRRHTAGLLSLKTRRNIRAGRKMIAESRLAKTLIDDLWEEFAQKRKQEDFYDLPWLLMQLRALLPFVNEGVSEIILGYAACLENMSPDLSFKRKKIADVKRGLPPHVTIVPETLRRYECAIEAHFKQHGLMIHFDPLKAANLVKGTGRERRKAMGECWVKSSPQGVYQEIMRRAALEAKLEARRHFEGYAAVLKNLSADLNDAPEKTRRPDQSVASFTGVSESQIARYVIEIETLLEGKKWAITLDPLATKKNNLRQGHALSSKISRVLGNQHSRKTDDGWRYRRGHRINARKDCTIF